MLLQHPQQKRSSQAFRPLKEFMMLVVARQNPFAFALGTGVGLAFGLEVFKNLYPVTEKIAKVTGEETFANLVILFTAKALLGTRINRNFHRLMTLGTITLACVYPQQFRVSAFAAIGTLVGRDVAVLTMELLN
jgi:hypothetical protein